MRRTVDEQRFWSPLGWRYLRQHLRPQSVSSKNDNYFSLLTCFFHRNNVVNFESVESFTNNAGATRYRPHSTNCARPQTFCGAGDDQICKGHRQCCGVYPERFPYSANKKQKHCCNKGEDGGIHEVLINTDKFACCADKGKIGNVTEVSDWEFTQLKNTCAGNTLPKPTWVAP